MSYRIVFGEAPRVGEWVRSHIACVDRWADGFEALGLEKNGRLVAGIVYDEFSNCSVSMHIAVEGRLTREFIRTFFAYPFVQLKLRRVTGLVPARNAASLNFCEHIGMKREGYIRHAMPDDDLVIMGMLRSECKWLAYTPRALSIGRRSNQSKQSQNGLNMPAQ